MTSICGLAVFQKVIEPMHGRERLLDGGSEQSIQSRKECSRRGATAVTPVFWYERTFMVRDVDKEVVV